MDQGIPRKVGRYEVDRLLGAGAMGFVYLGRDPDLDRAVAIKTVRDLGLDKEAREMFLERFRNEARAAAKLHHPSIVAVYDVGEDPEHGPYLVLEYVAGSTLKQILRSRGALDAAETLRLADQMAAALDAAHEAGIIHRDVKPDNVLVSGEGRAKLADFGVARVPNAHLTREGQFLGTPCYAAPETLAQGQYGRHSDLFSFAAVLYEIVSGVRAFPGDDAVAVAHKVINEEPPSPSMVAPRAKVPPSVDKVIMLGLAKDPGERPPTASDLVRLLGDAYVTAGVLSASEAASSSAMSLASASGAGVAGVVRANPIPGGGPRKGAALAFAAMLVGLLGVGVALIFAFAGVSPSDELPDAGVPIVALPRDAGPPDAGPADAGPPDAGGIDARVPAAPSADAGPPPIDTGVLGMTAHDREEVASDALDAARAALGRNDREEARRQLDIARVYDPGNPDIDELTTRLNALPPP